MSNISASPERSGQSGDNFTGDHSTGTRPAFDLAEMANIFEFAASRLLAIRIAFDGAAAATSAKRLTITKYLMWEGEVFFLPWIAYCEGLCISPPLSQNLRFFVGILGMSQLELINYQEFYDGFMKLPAEPSGAWIRGRIVNRYPLDWWNRCIDVIDHTAFTTSFPDCNQIRGMVSEHFAQLPEGHLLITPATLVQARSTPVAQQLATIQAGVRQEGDHIIKMLEDKVVEAKLVAASLWRMETVLGDDVRGAIAATEILIKYLKKEQTD